MPYSAAYSATKALVKTFGEAVWAELKKDGIDVLTLCPGATNTEAAAKQGIDQSKLADLKEPRDVALATLEHIKEGPTYYSSEHYLKNFEQLLAMPRGEALLAMTKAFSR